LGHSSGLLPFGSFLDFITKPAPVCLADHVSYLFVSDIGLDIQDDRGRHEVGFVENVKKEPIGDGGCNFEAKFQVNKVITSWFILIVRKSECNKCCVLGARQLSLIDA
jgi:hypothetical protein